MQFEMSFKLRQKSRNYDQARYEAELKDAKMSIITPSCDLQEPGTASYLSIDWLNAHFPTPDSYVIHTNAHMGQNGFDSSVFGHAHF